MLIGLTKRQTRREARAQSLRASPKKRGGRAAEGEAFARPHERRPTSHGYEAYDEAPDAGRLEKPADLDSVRTPGGVNGSMALVRKASGIDAAFVPGFAEDRIGFRALKGDAGSFGWQVGGIPLKGAIRRRVVSGRAEGSLENGEWRFSAPLSVALAMGHRLVEESTAAGAPPMGVGVEGDRV